MLLFVKNFSSKIVPKPSIYKALLHFCVIITRASTLLTMPVAFIYLSPYFTNYAVSICKRKKNILYYWKRNLLFVVIIPPARRSRATSLYTKGAFAPAVGLEITRWKHLTVFFQSAIISMVLLQNTNKTIS